MLCRILGAALRARLVVLLCALTTVAIACGIGPATAAGAPATLTPVSGSGQSTTVNTLFANPLSVIVQDSGGNTLPNVAVTFTAPAGPIASTATAVFNGTGNTITVNSDAGGTATVPAAQLQASQMAGQFNVAVSAGSATSTILLINAAGPAAKIVVSQGAGQQAVVGTTLTTVFVAQVVDSFGNPAPGVGVTFVAPTSGASGNFSGASTTPAVTDVNGLATAPSFTLNTIAGVYNVTANTTASPLANPANFNLVNLPAAAAKISVQNGSGQSAAVTTTYGTILTALVRDANNNPVPNVSVTFTAPSTGAAAAFSGSATLTVTTDTNGIATATTLTAGTTAGSFNISANYSGGTAVNYSLTNTPGAAANLAIQAGNNQSVAITASFTTNLAIVLTDAGGNPVPNASVTFTAPSSGPSGTFAGGGLTFTTTTSASGIATASTFTANATAGANYSITVTYATLSVSFTMTNLPIGSLGHIGGDIQQTTITKVFATPLSVYVYDSLNNAVPGIPVTFTAPTSGASGTFAGGGTSITITSDSSGHAVTPVFTANSNQGGYSVIASVVGGATATFHLTNNYPQQITVSAGSGQSATTNTTYLQSLSALVQDTALNPLSGFTVTFTVSGSGASGTFAGGVTTFTAVTNLSGIATASAFTANGTTGAVNVTASVVGVATPASFALTNIAQSPSSIALSPASTQSQSIVVNGTFSTLLGVLVKDVNLVALSNYSTVTFTVVPGGSGASASFGGASTITVNTDGSGISTATALTANGIAGPYTVTASVGGLTYTFNLTNQAPNAIAATGGTPQTTLINTNFGTTLQVQVKDSLGNTIQGATVTFTAPASTATGAFGGLATMTAVTNASGIAASSIITANGSVGTYTVTASVAGLTANFSLTNTTPTVITANAGSSQTTFVNTAFGTALQALVKDAANNAVSGVTVTFTAPGSGSTGTFANGTATTTAVTNGAGIATASTFTANGTPSSPGTFAVTASFVGAVTPASFTLTSQLAAPATAVASPASGSPQSTLVNTQFASALGVLVKDSGGTIIVGIPVTFTVNAAGGASGTFAGGVSSLTVNTNASGIATAPALTANATAGAYTVTATVGGLTVTFTVANTNTIASIKATAGNNQTAVISTAFGASLQATVYDASNNPVQGAVVTFSAPTSGASITGVPTNIVTNASGVAILPAPSANSTVGGYSVTATVQGTAISTTFSLTNTPGVAATIARSSGNGQSSPQGAAFAAPLVAIVKDSGGNPVPNVSVTFTAPTSGAYATFPGPSATATVTTDSSGLATSPTLTSSGNTGSFTVTAKAGSVGPVNFNLTNSAAVVGSVGVTAGSTQATVVNTNFGSVLQATVLNTLGNPVGGVTVTFTLPTTGASGSFAGSTTVTATTNPSGVATSPTLHANTVAGTFFAQATIGGVATPAIYTLTNNPGAPSGIVIVSGNPQSTIVNTVFAAPLVAQVKDIYNNPIPGTSVKFLAPTVGSVGSFAGSATTTVTTDSSGNATSPAVTANGTAGSYVVSASIPSGTFVNFNLTNTPAPASIVASGGNTQTTPVTTAYTLSLQVTVKDSNNLPVPGAIVTYTAPSTGASVTLSSTTATTNAAGVASVTATANTITGAFNVTAVVAGLPTQVSFGLTNTAGAPTGIVATGGNTQQTVVTTPYTTPLQVTVKDTNGNPVSGAIVTYSVPSSGASATLSSPTGTTNASGVASVNATANATVGGFTVTASVSGISTTFSLTNIAGAPTGITVSNGSPQTTAVTTQFTQPLQVTVKDTNNVPVPGAVVTFTVPGSGASATLSSATATTNASGIASVVATANTKAGSYNATATVAGLTATFSLTNTAGPAAGIVATGGSTQSTVVTNAFSNALQVTVSDTNGNPVSGVTVTYSAPTSGASASLSLSTVTTNASGIASVNATANTIVGGAYTVTASVTGITTPATFSLTNLAGAPAGITVSGGNNQTTPVTTQFSVPLQVTVKDNNNLPVPGAVVTFTLPGSGAGATLLSTTATTNASGVATVTATANTKAGSYTVTAVVGGLPTIVTFNLTNTAGAAAGLLASGGNNQSTQVTTQFGSALQVTVSDTSGNPVSGVTVTFAAPTTGATSVLSSTTGTTNAAGITSVTAVANAVPGMYSVKATVAGVPTPLMFTLTNTGTGSISLAVSTGTTLISSVGQSVQLSYLVTNSGTLPLTNVKVVDQKVSGVTCPATTLAVGASETCTATYAVTAADITNGGITSVANATGTTLVGSVPSAPVKTPIGIDVAAIRQKTISANAGLMQNRAQAVTSMQPNAERLHHRLTGSVFGDADAQEQQADEPAQTARRHDPMKLTDDVSSAGPSSAGGTGGSTSSLGSTLGMPHGAATALTTNARGNMLGYAGTVGMDDNTTGGGQPMPAIARLPFNFSGNADQGTGQFSFSTSLSQMREAAKSNAAQNTAGLNSGLGYGNAAGQSRQDIIDVWFEAQSAYYSSDEIDGRHQGHVSVAYAGIDAIVARGISIGMLVQRDWIGDSSSATGQSRDGTGWMAGPYLGVRVTPNIYFDGRVAFGSAQNSVNTTGAYSDSFETSRELLSARLTGDWKRGNWLFRPSAEITYYTEHQKAYVNQLGIDIPDIRVSLGKVTVGPEVGYRIKLPDQSVFEPYVGLKGVAEFGNNGDAALTGGTSTPAGITGRVEVGASYRAADDGVTLRASGSYDGIGSSTYRAVAGQAFVIVPIK